MSSDAPADAGSSADPRYQIGEVAQRTGLTQRTLRFYEEKGLLTPTDRMEGGFRLYSDSDIGRVELIKQLQGLLGFTLAEIKEMVEAEELRAQIRATRRPDRDLPERRQRVEQVIAALRRQLEVVEPKIEQLVDMRREIRERLDTLELRLQEIDEAIAAGRPSKTKRPPVRAASSLTRRVEGDAAIALSAPRGASCDDLARRHRESRT